MASHARDHWRDQRQLTLDRQEREREQLAKRSSAAVYNTCTDTSVHASATHVINSRQSHDRVTALAQPTPTYSDHSGIANFELPPRHVEFSVPRADNASHRHVVHRVEESDSDEEARRNRRRDHEEYFRSITNESMFSTDSMFLRTIQIRLRENSFVFCYGDGIYIRIIRLVALVFIVCSVLYLLYIYLWPYAVPPPGVPSLMAAAKSCAGNPRNVEDSRLDELVEYLNPFDDDDFTRYINDHAFSFIDVFKYDPRDYDDGT